MKALIEPTKEAIIKAFQSTGLSPATGHALARATGSNGYGAWGPRRFDCCAIGALYYQSLGVTTPQGAFNSADNSSPYSVVAELVGGPDNVTAIQEGWDKYRDNRLSARFDNNPYFWAARQAAFQLRPEA